MSLLTRRSLGLATLAAPSLALAQNAPPLRILVNGSAGSSVDLLCRTLADGLRERLARAVVVDNRVGAGGFASAMGVRGAPADGNVLIQTNIGVSALSPLVFRKPPLDPDAELAPLCHLTDTPFGLAVKPDAPGGGTLRGWLAALGARGAEIAVNSATGLPRFAVHLMAAATGQPLTPVIYRSSGAIIPDLEGGHVVAGMTIGAEFIEQHRGGRLRLLAQSLGDSRWSQAPEVLRFNEQGIDFVGSAWNGMFTPPGVPEPVRAQLAEAITAVLHSPAVEPKLRGYGMEPSGGAPAGLRDRIATDRARWAPVIAASGFKADEP